MSIMTVLKQNSEHQVVSKSLERNTVASQLDPLRDIGYVDVTRFGCGDAVPSTTRPSQAARSRRLFDETVAVPDASGSSR